EVGILAGHTAEHLVPEHHVVLHGVGLGGAGDLLSPVGSGVLEGIADHPLRPAAGEHDLLDGHLVGGTAVYPAAYARIFSFGVLPNAHHVDMVRALARQWA